jgi:hypothetical protein
MAEAMGTGFVAECYWPGVGPDNLRALDERVEACTAELGREGERVRYLGSMLMADDEVVLCLFEGSMVTVQRAAERARIPFERIVRSTGAPWSERAECTRGRHTGDVPRRGGGGRR